MKKPYLLIASALACVLISLAFADWYTALPPERTATYVGRATCAECHAQEVQLWQGSHHDHAMEQATPETVRGDFNDATFERLGVETRFSRRGDEFFVSTEGPDGQQHEYPVKYTFGYEPLQQYMIELEEGRVQVLRVSWDTEKEAWFYVPAPDAVDERLAPDDPLHWTGLAQNWNTMCAECHSTNLEKNFDLESNSYHTTFSEIDVSCETCHGPGSLHAEIAESRWLFWDRNHGYGLPNLKAKDNDAQIEACAPCHSRRGALAGGWQAGANFDDYYQLSLLEPGLYHADGQIQDEVYVYGSFLQSRMYHENVKCSDCHDPHSLKLKFTGNALCTQCHQNYDTKKHHFHTDLAATQCVNCHMPKRYYMVNDGRRDHSFRIPRPDLSVELGTPNACTDCHDKPGEDAAWAAKAIRKWYGPKRPNDPHYAPVLAAAWNADPDAIEQVVELLKWKPPVDAPGRRTPDIVRATALEAMQNFQTPESDSVCLGKLSDASPKVRAAALRGLSGTGIAANAGKIADRLTDASRLVRFAAADALSIRAPGQLSSPRDLEALRNVLDEYAAGQQVTHDRSGPHLRLAQLSRSQGDADAAIAALRNAIRVESYRTGPRAEIARLLAAQGRDAEEVERLRREEVELLRRDTELLPGASGPPYQLGMTLYLLGDVPGAISALEEAAKRSPEDYNVVMALALLYEADQQWGPAARTLKEMNRLRPNDPQIRAILQRIQQSRQQSNSLSPSP